MMHFLACLSIGFVAFQLVNVLLNLIFMQKIDKLAISLNEPISVLIPVRNEEENIGLLLSDFKNINIPNLEIIVYNDQSTDNTSAIVNSYVATDKRIELLSSKGLPDQWLGKNHACYQLAKQAKGQYFLFLDADVRINGCIIEDAISYLKKYNLGLLSAFPLQIQKSWGEKISVSVMNYILLTLLPLVFVRISPFTSHSAANGQFMLFNAEMYKKQQPHKTFRFSAVEDIAIAKYLKKKRIKTACITGDSRLKCRMYRSYHGALDGFAKNVFMFFGNKPTLAFLFLIFAALGFIPVLGMQINWMIVYFSAIIIIQLVYSYISKQNIVLNILLFPVQLLFLLHTMYKSLLIKKTKQYSWKGRNIYS